MTPGETSNGSDRPGLATGAVQLLLREATRAPLLALSLGLQAWERTRELRDLTRRRGDEVLQIAAHTPLGRFLPQPALGDGAEVEGQRIAADARETTIRVATPPESSREQPRPSREQPKPSREQPKPGSARPEPARPPAATTTPEARAAGAPGAVTDEVEQVSDRLGVAAPASRDDLPIPDFDNVSLASLRARLRSLSLEQLVMLREWEQAHAHRLPVVTLLDNRIAKLAAQAQAQPAATQRSAAATGERAARAAEQGAQEHGGTLRV